MPQERPASTHSSPVFRASNDPSAKEKGTLIPTRPDINAGGCTNMPTWVSNGLIPSPSMGTKGSLSKGLAITEVTAKKKASTSMSTPVV